LRRAGLEGVRVIHFDTAMELVMKLWTEEHRLEVQTDLEPETRITGHEPKRRPSVEKFEKEQKEYQQDLDPA
jgi:hypothetical protein